MESEQRTLASDTERIEYTMRIGYDPTFNYEVIKVITNVHWNENHEQAVRRAQSVAINTSKIIKNIAKRKAEQ